MKVFKRCFSVAAVLGLAFVLLKGIGYFVVDDTLYISRLMLHDFYQQEDIDILFVGASRTAFGIDAAAVEEKTGKKAFSVATSGQLLDASFALIREAAQLYDLEHVYLEVSDGVAYAMLPVRERTDELMEQTYAVSDYMRPSWNKLRFLLHASGPDRYLESFFLPHGDLSVLFEPEKLAEIYHSKEAPEYKAYQNLLTGDDVYKEKGFTRIPTWATEYAHSIDPLDAADVPDDWKTLLAQIIAFCRGQGIELTLFSPPTSDFRLLGKGNYDDNYDDYIAMVQEQIAGTGIEYVDFSLLKDAYFPRLMKNFWDYNHLNMYGARPFTEAFAGYINGTLPADAFYPSIAERLEDLPPCFYGIAWPKEEAESETRTISLVAAHPAELEYRVTCLQEGEDPVLLQDFSTNTEFSIPEPKGKTLRVEWKLRGAPNVGAEVVEYGL